LTKSRRLSRGLLPRRRLETISQSLFEVIDEEATFTTEFKKTWQTFMSECLQKMIQETLDEEKRLIEIMNLDHFTLDYDIYDAGDTLNLNDADFKAFLKKKLHNKGKDKQKN